jgi:hypothetical protein
VHKVLAAFGENRMTPPNQNTREARFCGSLANLDAVDRLPDIESG